VIQVLPSDAKEKADSILEEWDCVCNSLGIEHFLVFGTCLGMYRDKGYIVGDDDVDVGIWKKDFQKLYERMIDRGYTSYPIELIQREFNPEKIEQIAWGTHIKFIKYDICLDLWIGLIYDSHHKDFLDSFDKVTYGGREYKVPHPIEDYLKRKYGETWRIPLR